LFIYQPTIHPNLALFRSLIKMFTSVFSDKKCIEFLFTTAFWMISAFFAILSSKQILKQLSIIPTK